MSVTPDIRVPMAFHGVRLSAFADQASLTMEREAIPYAPLDAVREEVMGGQSMTSLATEGFLDDSYLADQLSLYQNDTLYPLFQGVVKNSAVGTRCYLGKVKLLTFGETLGRNQLPRVTFGGRGNFRILGRTGANNFYGSALAAGTHDQTGVNLGATSATQLLVSQINVVTLTGTSPTVDVILETDASDSWSGSETTRVTHAQLTAAGSGILSTAGAITDTWARHSIVIGGTGVACTIIAGMAIIPNTVSI